MKKNFVLKDAQIFSAAKEYDLGDQYELESVCRFPYPDAVVKVVWRSCQSNRHLIFVFRQVEGFEIKSRDPSYPLDSNTRLAISGFCNRLESDPNSEYFVEPDKKHDFFCFQMEDESAILIKANIIDLYEE